MSSRLSENCHICSANYSPCSCEEEIRQEMEETVYDNLHELVEKTLGPNGLSIDDKLFWENEEIGTVMELAISTITHCLTKYKYKEKLEIELTNNISIISSFASNSVYIGLLGTVFGIIITFLSMGESGDIDVKIIMSSLGLALKATAMGLIVAIPAMMFYNHLVRKIEIFLSLWDLEQKEMNDSEKI